MHHIVFPVRGIRRLIHWSVDPRVQIHPSRSKDARRRFQCPTTMSPVVHKLPSVHGPDLVVELLTITVHPVVLPLSLVDHVLEIINHINTFLGVRLALLHALKKVRILAGLHAVQRTIPIPLPVWQQGSIVEITLSPSVCKILNP